MSNVTLVAIEELMDNILDKKLDEKLEPIKKVQAQHTASLELLLSERGKKDDNHIVVSHRLDRLEKWGKKVGEKVDLKLDF
jgi:hypothetical protein